MSLSSNKLQEFRVDIRKQSLASLMKKMRYQVVQNSQKQRLQALIDIPLQSFKIQHLHELVQFVNLDQTNAILHFGNLIIDRFINIQSLEKVQLRLGKNEYVTWLINSMTQINYCTSEMLEYLVSKISVKKSAFSLENALQALHRCLKSNPQHTLTYMDCKQEFLLALVNHIHDPNDKLSTLSLAMLVQATSYNEEMPLQIKKVVGEARLENALHIASMKIGTHPRILAIQIANNLIMSGVILQEVVKRVLENSFTQKQNVRLELSYYLIAAAQKLLPDMLVQLIQDYRLLQVLKDFIENRTNRGKYATQIKQNAVKTIKYIYQRFGEKRQRQLMNDLQRMGINDSIEQMVDQAENNTIL